MSQAEVERFVADLKGNERLRSQLSGHAAGIASVVAFASDKGYDFTADEAASHIHELAGRELNDSELDAVAGGKGHSNETSTSSVATSTNVAAAAEVAATSVEAAATATTVATAAEVVIVLT